MRTRSGIALALLALLRLAPGLAPGARAESWCALPLEVHEWGVFVIGADGRATATPDLPSYFHRPGDHGAASRPMAVRDLPADSGVRTLPIVHFYAPRGGFGDTIPVGIEVGFAGADAAVWFPRVDRLRTLADASTPEALLGRARVLADRALRIVGTRPVQAEPPADPTRQLVWDRLELTRAAPPGTPPAAADVPWVARARALDALWVSAPGESERFVFYEATTREPAALVLSRGPTWSPTRRHLLVENRGRHPVHDVFLIHREVGREVGREAGREAGRVYVVELATIPAGQTAGLVLDDHLVPPGELAARTRDRLRDLLIDHASPEPPTQYDMERDDCVMGRDPALPFERAAGHRLYRDEIDLLLEVWAARFFEGQGTRVLYREDTAHLDEVMPLSIYTDMYHVVRLRRASLALLDGVVLP
ncbi:MAG: hypothetical protein IT385_14975 [Deltaproteobacteria bacterium]|nr:hypothetical protein [Deltaproteobacteria bacterium]